MPFVILYWNPWWRAQNLLGPWAVKVWCGQGFVFEHYFRRFSHAWFHLLVSFGVKNYDG